MSRRAGSALELVALGAFAALAAWTPALALACPVCFGADEANRDAFLATTVFMSLFPLAMIGGLLAFLAKRAREADLEAAGARTEPRDVASTERPASAAPPAVTAIPPTTDGGASR